jgi:hypothetical protein
VSGWFRITDGKPRVLKETLIEYLEEFGVITSPGLYYLLSIISLRTAPECQKISCAAKFIWNTSKASDSNQVYN